MLKKTLIRTCVFTLLLWSAYFTAEARIQPRMQPISSDGLEKLQANTIKAWRSHLIQANTSLAQPGCNPYYLAPKQMSKGVVILLHGFTACSQQNDGLATQLAQEGYHVFVPRLPGHGLPAQQTNLIWHDHLESMPQFKDYRIYQTFASNLSDLVKDEPGIKTIAGVSLGGTLAASAILQSPGVFDRGILMTPVFDIVEPQNLVLPLLQKLIPNQLLHWGATCDLERSKHRGGYCEFSISQVRAMQQFGSDTLKQMSRLGTRVQLVGVEGDGAASNPAILTAAKKVPFGQACLFEKGSSHSMLSPYDNQHEDKFWVDALESQIIRFIDLGTYFDQTQPSLEAGFMRCRSR